MATSYFQEPLGSSAIGSRNSPLTTPGTPSSAVGTPSAGGRGNALSTRLASILSASYSDLGTRGALETLDARGIKNTPETRRQLRLDVQREVVQVNGEIIHDFGRVAERLKRIGTAIDSLNKCCADIRESVSAANVDTAPILDESKHLLAQKSEIQSKEILLKAVQTHFLLSDEDQVTLSSTVEPVDDHFFTVLARVKRIHKDSQILLSLSEHQKLGLEVLESSSHKLNGAFQKLYRWVQREFRSTLDLENPQISASIRRALRVLAERPALFQSCLDYFAEVREGMLSDAFYDALTASSRNENSTGSGAAPVSNPIEFQAHDPLRYVGDMLAWAHSATVSEREALEVLFIGEGDEIAKGMQVGFEREPWTRSSAEDAEDIPEDLTASAAVFDGRKALGNLVSRNLAGVMRQIRQRTEQVIQSHEDATLAFNFQNLLTFYKATFSKLLGAESVTLTTLNTLSEAAQRQFRSTTRDIVTQIQTDLSAAPDAPPESAPAPPDFLIDALETLGSLLRSYDNSLPAAPSSSTSDADGSAAASDGFSPVLAEALDPYLAACEELSRRLGDQRQSSIFALNCLLSTQIVLNRYPATTASRSNLLQAAIKNNAKGLVAFLHRFLLEESGVHPLLAVLKELENASLSSETKDEAEDSASSDSDSSHVSTASTSSEQVATIAKQIAANPAFSLESLGRSAAQLDSFLPEALIEASALTRELSSVDLARKLVNQAAAQFCSDFEILEKWIERTDATMKEAKSGDAAAGGADEGDSDEEESLRLRTVYPRTGADISVLLS